MDISFKETIDNQKHRFNYRVAAIISSNGRFLIHKFVGTDFFFLPGGRVQMGETSAQAIVREIQEELELNISEEDIVLQFVVENFFNYADESFHEVSMYYHLPYVDISSLPSDGEIQGKIEFYWKPPEKFADLNMQPEFLREALLENNDKIFHIVNYGKGKAKF